MAHNGEKVKMTTYTKNENTPTRHIASFIINVKLHFYKMGVQPVFKKRHR